MENAVLRGQLAVRGGERADWPDDVPALFTADHLRAWVPAAASAANLPATLVELHCDEFPCIAVFAYHDGVAADSTVMDPVRLAFLDASQGEGAITVHLLARDQAVFAAVPFVPGGPVGEQVHARTMARIQDLLGMHAEAAEP